MKRYGIIGGTFDPIHNAHLYIAYEAKKQLALDNIVFIPTGIQPLKVENKVTDSAVRYNMVNLAIEPYEEFLISDYEIKKNGVSFTHETLEYFKTNYNSEDAELFFITGADCLINIDKWKDVHKILSLCNFVVFSRGGVNLEDIKKKKEEVEEKYNCNIIFLELNELEISSTDIRNRVKDGRRIDFFVPEKVNKFIIENGLYKE